MESNAVIWMREWFLSNKMTNEPRSYGTKNQAIVLQKQTFGQHASSQDYNMHCVPQ